MYSTTRTNDEQCFYPANFCCARPGRGPVKPRFGESPRAGLQYSDRDPPQTIQSQCDPVHM
eukprot:COSAG06_NODE_860_length_11903_cov_3.097170_13_plen_61_part_00